MAIISTSEAWSSFNDSHFGDLKFKSMQNKAFYILVLWTLNYFQKYIFTNKNLSQM